MNWRCKVLKRVLKDLITEQSCGEWDQKTIDKDIETFYSQIVEELELDKEIEV